MKNRINIKNQHAPFTIQIEPTEGCNLGCPFCGLRGMREKGTTPHYFMTVKLAQEISRKIKEAGWHSKIIFAMHGEPTLNKNLFNIIKIFRHNLPDSIFHVISNGYGIAHDSNMSPLEYVTKLKDSGVNHLLLDNYSPKGDWSKVVESVGDTYEILELGKDKTPMFRSDKKFNVIVLPPINTVKISLVRNLVNHSGAAAPLDRSFNNKICTNPFRELSFRHNGNVAICCDDFRGKYRIGNISDYDKIDDLWNNERFKAARIMLYNHNRNFSPCDGCTNLSMRVGLLPDIQGKETLPPISDFPEIKDVLNDAVKDGAYAKIYKRPWEK